MTCVKRSCDYEKIPQGNERKGKLEQRCDFVSKRAT